MLLIALACVKYPEFSQYRLEPPTSQVPPAPERSVDTPRPDTARLVAPKVAELEPIPAPFSLNGTRWTLFYTSPDGSDSYPLTFGDGGAAKLESPHDTTPENDRWTQTGATVELTMNDAFVSYQGVFTDASIIRGTAANAEHSWGFAMVRQGAAPTREMRVEDDLRTDPELARALTGTRWSLTDLDPNEPLDMELTLHPDGELETSLLGPDGLPYSPNRWHASDGALYFWINDRSVEHVALPTWPGQMVGAALSETASQWGFRLTQM